MSKQEVVISETTERNSKRNPISRRDFLKLSAAFGTAAAVSDFTFNGPLKTLVAGAAPAAVQQDQWIKSECRICATICYINAHVIDGIIDKIEGYPDPVRNRGVICARGGSGHWWVYDPYRLKAPLKRTNPQKGVGVDPKWVEISWDEAYNTIAAEAKKVRAKGNDGTFWVNEFSNLRYSQAEIFTAFKTAMAGNCYSVEMGMNWCGHLAHYLSRLIHGNFQDYTDFTYCNYQLLFGSEQGLVYHAAHSAQDLAPAHKRGMRIVSLTPARTYGANIVDEWVPILPATDGAFASAMLNVLIHELGIYDVDFLKKYTNAPYLIRADTGYYSRDKATDKPLVYDPVDNKAKTFDDPSIKDFAMDGTFTVDGVSTNPAWQLFKDAIKPMNPEWAETITTAPASTIRRIAKEFGQAAQVGSTIVVDGVQRSYRPVAMVYYANASNHVHGFANSVSTHLLLTILGAWDAPGSQCIYPRNIYWPGPAGGHTIQKFKGWTHSSPSCFL